MQNILPFFMLQCSRPRYVQVGWLCRVMIFYWKSLLKRHMPDFNVQLLTFNRHIGYPEQGNA